jgi:hypothetical protein
MGVTKQQDRIASSSGARPERTAPHEDRRSVTVLVARSLERSGEHGGKQLVRLFHVVEIARDETVDLQAQ